MNGLQARRKLKSKTKFKVYYNATRYIISNLPLFFDLESLAAEVSMKYGLEWSEALILCEVLKELRESFPNKSSSWFQRAALRALTVRKVSDKVWVVSGFYSLGDSYTRYAVRYDSEEKRYICDCFLHFMGRVREYKICTHVAAVIVYRKMQRRLSEWIH